MSEYVVIYEQAEDGAWGAYLPDLPGVVALALTRAEAEQRIGEALAAYANDLQERDRHLPKGSGKINCSISWDRCSRGL